MSFKKDIDRHRCVISIGALGFTELIDSKFKYIVKKFHKKNKFKTFNPVMVGNKYYVVFYNYEGNPTYPFKTKKLKVKNFQIWVLMATG
jgi:hypothetical protein